MPTKQPTPPPVKTKQDVVLRGNHPHSGKYGWIPLNAGVPETINLFGNLMVKIEFPDGTGCYAEQRHLAMIEPTAPPPPKKR